MIEPSPAQGYKFLEPGAVTQLSLGKFSTKYQVAPQPYRAFLGSLYKLFTIGGWGRQEYDCGPSNIVPGISYRGCPNEQTASDGFLQRYPFTGSNATAYFSGEYMLDPPTAWWGGGGTNGLPGLVSVARNAVPPATQRKWHVVYPQGSEYVHGVDRTDVYQCPPLFGGLTNGNQNPWPRVCVNSSYGYITVQSLQYASCAKDGNPCVAATGNKEYREEDFTWAGVRFARAYNSIRDLPLLSGLGDNWAHAFSDRVLLASYASTDMYWIRSDGYFELFSKLADGTTYRSRNESGLVLVREPDAIAAIHGRWRIQSGDTTRWFNETGRLQTLEASGKVLRFAYCDDTRFSSGECATRGYLRQVTSEDGRTLHLSYVNVAVPLNEQGDVRMEPRLTTIRSNGATLATYEYDARARLVTRAIDGTGRQYLYAEDDQLCRDGAGQAIQGCSPANFPFHLTGVMDERAARLAWYTYDQLGRVTASAYPNDAGRIALNYRADGSVAVTTAAGGEKVYEFSATGFRKPTAIKHYAGGKLVSATSWAHSDMQPASVTAAGGARTDYAYESRGLLTQQIETAND